MIVKILGAIDLAAAFAFLMLVFEIEVFTLFLLFSAGLLAVKGMFVFGGDVLSFVDLFAAVVLIISILWVPPSIFLWIPTFLLLAKGVVSFV